MKKIETWIVLLLTAGLTYAIYQDTKQQAETEKWQECLEIKIEEIELRHQKIKTLLEQE